jgi:hypothetical protein
MLDTIIMSISNRQTLSFTYDGLIRTVEPHAVGVSTAGNDVLRCFQTHGAHITPGHEWDMCLLSKISNLVLTGQHFHGERPGYKRGDKGMTVIYAQL